MYKIIVVKIFVIFMIYACSVVTIENLEQLRYSRFTLFLSLAYKQKNKSLIVVLTFIAIRSSFDLRFMAMQFMPVIFLFYPTLREYLDNK